MTTNMAVRKSDWLMKIEIQGSVITIGDAIFQNSEHYKCWMKQSTIFPQ